MKIALIYNLNRGKFDYEAEFDQDITINALKKVLRKEGSIKCIEGDRNYSKWISTLVNYKPEIIFSVAEGYAGSCRESFYPSLYEQLGYKYAGPDVNNLFIFQNKYLTKKLAQMTGILVPNGYVISGLPDHSNQKNRMKYPLIVKPNFEGSSIGISSTFIVKNREELSKQLKQFFKKYNKTVIIEEFIEGIDVSMVYVEGIGALGPSVINYPEKNIYDWKLKTVDDETVSIVEGRALSITLQNKLAKIVTKLALAFDIKSYAKIDFRIDKKGDIYLLEVNGQVSFHPKGEFVVAAEMGGYSFEQVVSHILHHSIKNTQKRYGGYNF